MLKHLGVTFFRLKWIFLAPNPLLIRLRSWKAHSAQLHKQRIEHQLIGYSPQETLILQLRFTVQLSMLRSL